LKGLQAKREEWIMAGTVTIHKRYFTDDDICDGDIVTEFEEPEVISCETTGEAVYALCNHGLWGYGSLSVDPVPARLSGHEWFTLPEGSVTADEWDANYSGRLMEMSGHLHGWSAAEFARIVREVVGK
jgi:hypothetical protein